MKTKQQILMGWGLTALIFITLPACNNDDDAPAAQNDSPTADGVVTKRIDATAGGLGAAPDNPANKYTYVNLQSGEILSLTDTEAASSTDWHIAFKRTSIKLNGGVSGPGAVRAAIADAQEDFYDENDEPNVSIFVNASSDSELAAMQATFDLSGLTLASDRNLPAIISDGGNDSWWRYNPSVHGVQAAADVWWLVKSAEGNSYAKFHVTDIVQASRGISVEMFIQGASDSAFSTTAVTYTAAIGESGVSKCYDIGITEEVDCASAADSWDLKFEVSADGRAWNIWTNGGVSGGGDGAAFGPLAAEVMADYVNGSVTASGNAFHMLYDQDSAGGPFVDNTWFAYSLQGNQRLWPNYRVYVIDTGTANYAMQILSFYDEAGTSGMIQFRYKSLSTLTLHKISLKNRFAASIAAY